MQEQFNPCLWSAFRGLSEEEEKLFDSVMGHVMSPVMSLKPVLVSVRETNGTEYRFMCDTKRPGRDLYKSMVSISVPFQGSPMCTGIGEA